MKTIMMVVIVLYHSMLFFGGKWFEYVNQTYNADYLYNIAIWPNTFHIQVFTMVSGFSFYYLKNEKNKYNNPRKDIKKRTMIINNTFLFSCVFMGNTNWLLFL